MTNTNPSVYFARVGNYLKVGYSAQVKQRMYSLCTGSSIKPPDLPRDGKPVLLGTIPGNRALELDIQSDLWEWKVAGEWFEATPEVLAVVDSLLKEAA